MNKILLVGSALLAFFVFLYLVAFLTAITRSDWGSDWRGCARFAMSDLLDSLYRNPVT